ncbi:ATP-binding protein [Planktothrix agardhii]|uniref:ATP-binding protein n=1 Tax=Planktothrix agardhii TaxID=1160 RepID=UPI001F383265|nr:ATP-binding protein [Planktothrix agardhii]MCF3570123.1 ATP-binding protein [Planktothrix agardhii 1805]
MYNSEKMPAKRKRDMEVNDQEREKQLKFLENVALHCQFKGICKKIFLERFDPANYEPYIKTAELARKIDIDEPKFNQTLQKICFNLFEIKKEGPGRSQSGESPWEKTYALLWTGQYDRWKNDFTEWQKEILKLGKSITPDIKEQLSEIDKLSTTDESLEFNSIGNTQPYCDNHTVIVHPFIPSSGLIEEPHLFFGRTQEIKRIFETLNSGSSVAIIGESQIGKSSLLMEIGRQAQTQLRQPRKAIYINLLNIHDQEQFYEELCHHAGITTFTGIYLKRNLKDHRLLLILDEVEKMTWDGFTNYIHADLRGLAEGNNAVLKLVVAACTSLDQLFGSQGIKMTSPWWGVCTEYQLKRWDEQTSRDFIASRLNSPLLKPEHTTITFTEDEITELINKSEGHPQKLMALSYQTFNRYLD